MYETMFQGVSARLVTEQPDGAVSVRLTLPTEKIRGLTGREGRRALGTTLRAEMRWTSTLLGDRSGDSGRHYIAELRNLLQADGDDPDLRYLVPFWPAMVRVSESATMPISSEGLWLAWRKLDSGTETWYVLGSLAELAPVAHLVDYVAPGLVGRLEVTTDATDPSCVRARFAFREDAPSAEFALSLAEVEWELGPELVDETQPKVCEFTADWRRDPGTGTAEVEVERRPLGPSREAAAAYFPQNAERLVQAQVSVNGLAAAARLLRWWQDVRGDVEAHFVTTLLTDARLAAPAYPGETTIQIRYASFLGANRLLVLDDGAGGREWVRILSISTGETDTCTLSAPLARAWVPGTTHLSLAMLARHARPELEVEWVTPGYATAALAWREVPAELQPAAGETRGMSIGAEPTLAWLYELTVERVGGTPQVTRLTSYERDLTASGQTWTTWGIDHTELRQSLRLDRDETTLRMRYREPLSLFLPGRHDAVIRVAIHRCTVSGATGSNVEQLFGGEVTRCEADGPFMSLACAGINRLFGRAVPRFLMQRGCNHVVFDTGCGLSRSGWSLTAVVVSVSGASVTLGTFTPGGSVPGGWGGAHWFAAGYLERSDGRRSLILDSTAKTGGGEVTLTLVAAAVPALSVSETVTVLPGCDGDFTTCLAKFTNTTRFGGFPFLPDRSPQLQPLKKSTSVAGKK